MTDVLPGPIVVKCMTCGDAFTVAADSMGTHAWGVGHNAFQVEYWTQAQVDEVRRRARERFEALRGLVE